MEQRTEITAKLDVESLAEAWAKKKGQKPKFLLDIHIGARTDLGLIRENNEDKYEFFEPEESELLAVKGYFYAVADGMGGHASGQIASELALKTIVKTYYADPGEDIEQSLREAYRIANSYIYDTALAIPGRQGMGTTCTAIILRDEDMYLAQVGDSRLYRIREGEIQQVSEDHSWVAEQVKFGMMTKEEAELSPFRNIITRSIGTSPDVEPDISSDKIKKDDVFVLCSDGLSGYVSDEEILDLTMNWSPAMAALKLIDRANEHGGGDNITVMVVAVRDIQKSGSTNPNRLQKIFGLGKE